MTYPLLVSDSPLFYMKIQLLRTEKVWDGQSGYLTVKNAKLVNKVEKERDTFEP